MQEKILILDFGGQYNQLIARRVREQNVYCEIKPYTTTLDEIRAFAPMGIIFTGGPNSVYLEESPHVDPEVFRLGVPILGICYGCQLMAHTLGGQVTAAQEDTAREYGKTVTYYDTGCKLFKGIPEQAISWMSHGDYMAKVPEGFALVAHTDACPNAAIADESRGFYGVQFHPEATSFTKSAAPRALGRWGISAKIPWHSSGTPSDPRAACCWRCPAAWIPPFWRRCWPKR